MPKNRDEMLQELLERNTEAGALTYRLFRTTRERIASEDQLLAAVMPLCALPPAFDAAIIGVLRDAPGEVEQNQRLLEKLMGYSFVQAFEDGAFTYHETLRETLRAQLQTQHSEEILAIYQRLSAFYLERGKDIYHYARNHHQQQFDRAIIEFNRGLQVAPDNRTRAEYHHWRGRVYVQLRQYERAMRNFSQAIELLPTDWRNYYRRATMRIELQQYTEAITDLDTAISLCADVAKSFFARGTAYSKLQNYQRALNDFDHAIELLPEKPDTHAEIHKARGIIYWRLQEYDRALQDLTRAIDLAPNDGDHFFWRGVIHRDTEELDEAVTDFSTAIQLQEQIPINYRWRGAVYQEQEQFEKAERDFTQAITLEPDNAATYYWRGMVRYYLRRYDAALADFNEAIERDKNQCLYYIWRGAFFYGRSDDAAARRDFDRAVELCPMDYLPYEKRASTLYANQLELLDNALADLHRAIELQPDYGQSYFWRALVYLDLGRNEEAFSDIERSVHYEPQRARGFFWRGVMRHLRGETAAADDDWDQALVLAERSPPSLKKPRLALPLLIRGDKAGAIDCYTTALQGTYRADLFRYQLAGLQRLQRLYPQREDIAEVATWLARQMRTL